MISTRMSTRKFMNNSIFASFLILSTVKAQTINPICYVCGGDPNATVTNPTLLIDIPPEVNAPVPQATCQQIYQAGLDNVITVEQCDIIILEVDIQILCGCSNIDVPDTIPEATPTPAPVEAPTHVPTAVPTTSPVVASINPICYVCSGDPNATVTNPALLIDIPPELNAPVPQATCQQIYQAGLDREISVEQCDAILLDIDSQILCGCSTRSTGNVVAPIPTSKPDLAPTSVPTDVPVPVEKDFETNPPGTSFEGKQDGSQSDKSGGMMGKVYKKRKPKNAGKALNGRGMGRGMGKGMGKRFQI